MKGKFKNVDWARMVFIVSAGFAIFLAGGVFSTFRKQPYQFFEDGARAAVELAQERLQTRHELVEKTRYQGDGLVSHDPRRAYAGLTLVQGLFPDGVEIRLLNMAGDVIHRWRVDFFEIWPDPAHVPEEVIPATRFNYHTQGMWLLRDGSVVFNVGGYGTVKMDRCGVVIWTVDQPTHHSITPTPDGGFWVPVHSDPSDIDEEVKLEGIDSDRSVESLIRYEDRLLKISADGDILEDLPVLRAFFSGEYEHQLFDAWAIKSSDLTHINDIEVVTPSLADRIAGVDAGDLLVSVRNMHMLIIVDRENGSINWHQSGPWVRQHDPDITDEGFIEVFDNGGEHHRRDRFHGSRIVGIDPASDRIWTIYPASEEQRFYSRIMGSHQPLDNGNRLITESMAGRVFEITVEGDIVWDYVKRYDDTHAALFESAIRYDMGYLLEEDWQCPANGTTNTSATTITGTP